MRCVVKLVWDNEAGIWYTETDDIPGLVLHSVSFDKLVERVRLVAPELLEENMNHAGPVHILFESERIEEAFSTIGEAIAVAV